MLFKVGNTAAKEARPKNQMTIADILAFRDTWTGIPSEDFSVERILYATRLEKQKQAEVPKLIMSENGFRVRDKSKMDEAELELRRVQATLNKLTEKNFDEVSQEILSHDLICNKEVLTGAVNIIFTKAVAEPVFSSLYARLCARIANYENDLATEAETNPELQSRLNAVRLDSNTDQKGSMLRVTLVSRCQAFYEEFTKQSIAESEEAEEQRRKMNMSNIKFVGELYMKSLVSSRVVVIIASYTLGLGMDPSCVKTTISDVDLEMAYNLFTVVGKRLEDAFAGSPVTESIWDAIQKATQDKSFSTRIRFLLQNLLDWRKGGWKPKDTAPLASSSANTEGSNQGPSHKSMHRQHANHQEAHQVRRQDRATSYNDLSQLNNNNNNNNSSNSGFMQQPPPPFMPNMYPPPFPEPPKMSDEDKKLMALAQPPKSFTDEIEMKVLSVVRDAAVDGDWAAADAAILATAPEADYICRQFAVYALIKKVSLSPIAADREVFSKALDNEIFAEMALTRGFSWFLTEAITMNAKEDAPMAYARFAQRVSSCKALSFLPLLRDVIARTANYLDALYAPYEGAEGEWEEDFVNTCAELLKGCVANHTSDKEMEEPQQILSCIAAVKQRPFMRDTAADLISELSGHGLITDDDVQEWLANNQSSERAKAFVEQLEQLF